ncbi:MAG: helix-turn-helix domain-containing protein [Nitrospira sp. CR1.3]|nr:helix-turn-helix domain-containing protein [Nitrospira sp. CR1.3]
MGHKHEAESLQHFRNLLKNLRVARGFTQGELAEKAGITRQAVSSIESNLYLPTTAVALRLASILACRVEDLFSLAESDDTVEATVLGALPTRQGTPSVRVKLAVIGKQTVARPVTDLGAVLSFTVPADGYVIDEAHGSSTVKVRVRLSRDRQAIEQEISVAGCDPAIFLAGEHLRRRKDQTSVVGWTMGSMAALRALQNGEVHVAGLHLFDPTTGESNLPFLRQALKGSGYEVVTFATWEEGILVRPGNPKSIRSVADLAEPSVTMVNREQGAGARLLLDQQLRVSGTDPARIRGYERVMSSHFEVARAVKEHQADAGIGIRSAAQIFELDFVPIQSARYDLVVPKSYLKSHPTLAHLFETIVSRPFRNEIQALGGYDTSDTGKVQAL